MKEKSPLNYLKEGLLPAEGKNVLRLNCDGGRTLTEVCPKSDSPVLSRANGTS